MLVGHVGQISEVSWFISALLTSRLAPKTTINTATPSSDHNKPLTVHLELSRWANSPPILPASSSATQHPNVHMHKPPPSKSLTQISTRNCNNAVHLVGNAAALTTCAVNSWSRLAPKVLFLSSPQFQPQLHLRTTQDISDRNNWGQRRLCASVATKSPLPWAYLVFVLRRGQSRNNST